MPVMEGRIDHLGRPVLAIRTAGPDAENFLCLIDTGFNRYLLLEHAAALRFGFRQQAKIVDQMVLGDGSIRMAEIFRGSIIWLGAEIIIDAHVVRDARHLLRYSS